MKLRVTKNTDSHDKNQEYPCFVIDLEPSDTNFHFSPHPNWMPTEDQILDVNQILLGMSRTFKPRLCRQLVVEAWLDGTLETQKLENYLFKKNKIDISIFM